MKQLKIAPAILLAVGLVAAGLAAVALASLWNERSLAQHVERLMEKDWVKLTLTYQLKQAALDNRGIVGALFIETDPSRRGALYQAIEDNRVANQKAIAQIEAILYLPEGRARMKALNGLRSEYIAERNKALAFIKAGKMDDARAQWTGVTAVALERYLQSLDSFANFQQGLVDGSKTSVDESVRRNAITVAVLSLLAIGIGLAFGFAVARAVSRPLGRAVEVADAIAAGRLDNAVEAQGRNETAALLRALGKMQDQLRERAERDAKLLAENGRIRQALDNARVNVRIADPEGTLVYANKALLATLKRIEPEIRRRHPDFRAEAAVGQSVGIFYADPQAALARLAALQAPASSRMEIGGRHFDVNTTPVVADDGTRLGTVGEWVDVTERLGAEREIAAMVAAAASGDFSRRASTESSDEFLRAVAEGLNRIAAEGDRSLGEVSRVLAALADGDLTRRVGGQHAGVYARMQSDVNSTVDRLGGIVSQVKGSAESIGTASKQIASGNEDLSSRTEQQASSLQQTAASMEEITSTVKQNAENAKQADAVAADAARVASQGGQVVGEVVRTMGSIEESSQRIADIIGVIDGIAFQTNILALNAAVEAARAGEQGRGFAVVAGEVRNLAQRSADAAREIKSLIGDSVGKVDAGTKLVRDAGRTMETVVESVRRVSSLIGEIAAASREQSSGIEQVSLAISQMDQATQQNATLVGEAASAAASMREQAEGMNEAMAAFRVAA